MGFIDLVRNLAGLSSWDYAERRSKERVDCRIEASMVIKSGLIGVDVQNVSVTGMQLMCFGKVHSGAQVELRAVKPNHEATHHSLRCRIEWAKKQAPGWLAGVSFLDSAKDLSKSWLYWELKGLGVKIRGAHQKRENVRVKCLLPSRVTTAENILSAKTVNLSPSGAQVYVLEEKLKVGQMLTLNFGPVSKLPKIELRAQVVSIQAGSSSKYGMRFVSFEDGTPKDLKRYLDFFFKD